MDETGYLKAEWQAAHVTHCSEHSATLLDTCPVCDTPYKWSGDLFECCLTCETPWHKLETRTSTLPSYQPIETTHTSDSLRALYVALIFTLRPNDLMFDSLQTLQINNATLHTHFLQAHALLTDSEYRKAWLSNYSIDRIFYPVCKGIALDVYLDRLEKEYGNLAEAEFGHQIPDGKYEIQSVVRKPRQALASSPSGLNRQVGLVEASKYLALSNNELMELIDLGHLRSLNAPRSRRSRLFDVQDLLRINQRLLARTLPTSMATGMRQVPLRSIFSKLKSFRISRAQLIDILITSSDISLYSDQETGLWHDAHVCEASTLAFLESLLE